MLARGGDIHLHGVTNTVRWFATGDDKCYILFKIIFFYMRTLTLEPSVAGAEVLEAEEVTNPVIRITDSKQPFSDLVNLPRIAMFNISQCCAETDIKLGR